MLNHDMIKKYVGNAMVFLSQLQGWAPLVGSWFINSTIVISTISTINSSEPTDLNTLTMGPCLVEN